MTLGCSNRNIWTHLLFRCLRRTNGKHEVITGQAVDGKHSHLKYCTVAVDANTHCCQGCYDFNVGSKVSTVQFCCQRTEMASRAKQTSWILPVVGAKTDIHSWGCSLFRDIPGVLETRFCCKVVIKKKTYLIPSETELLIRIRFRWTCEVKVTYASSEWRYNNSLHPIYYLILSQISWLRWSQRHIWTTYSMHSPLCYWKPAL